MANNKKFVVENGLQTQNIDFVSTNGNNTIQFTMLDSDTLSVSGNSGQLFSITDSLTGTIFAVNDISGVPSIEVFHTGKIQLAELFGNVLIGTSTDNTVDKLQINGSISATILKSTVAVGTPPLVVNSATLVSNLNADLLDGYQSSTSDAPSTVPVRDSNNLVSVSGLRITTGEAGYSPLDVLRWNTLDKTYDFQLLNGVTGQMFQEKFFYGRAVGDIANGDVVMFAGAQGDQALFTKANTSAVGFQPRWVIGVATQDIPNNNWGYVTTYGKVRDLLLYAYPAGTILYLDPAVPGGFTSVEPIAPLPKIVVAAVLRESTSPTAENAIILVRPDFGYHLYDLHDVEISNPTNNQVIAWNSTLSRWENTNAVLSINGVTGAVTATNLLDAIKTVDGTGSGLDADLLDGQHATAFYLATNPAGYITSSGSITGNAATATALQTARTISLTGDVTYTSGAFNGSANVTGTSTLATVNSNVGTFGSSTQIPSITVNAKGLVTAVSTTAVSIPSGAISVTGGDLTLSGTTGTAITNATLVSVGTAGTYTKVTTDAKGRVTVGASLSASDIPVLDASKITTGVLDAARLPSYVDDVLEYTNLASFPATGETGKIYIALDTNKTYRWSGSVYVFITSGAVDSVAGKTGVVTLVKADVGLGNVDNTSDANKPVSTAQQAALNAKEPTIAAGTTAKYWRGDKTWQDLNKAAVGLGNVDNTADSTKSVASAATLTTARTINGVSFNGSANITVSANTTNALTIGTGLSGTSFNGSSAVTIAIDSTVATLSGVQTLTNKTINLSSNTLVATSAQIAASVTDETGTGSLVFATSPTLVTPALGTPSSGNLANCTFPILNQNTTGTASNVTGTVAVANGGTGATTAETARSNLGAQATLISGTNIKTINGGSILGSGDIVISGGSSWIKKTANYTALDKDQIIADTTAGSFTITLPATPILGFAVVIADGNDWKTTNLTIGRNGSTIEGLSEDLILDIAGIRVEFVYDGSTWEVYTFASPSIALSDDTTTDVTQYPAMTRSTTGPLANSYVSSTKLNFNPSTGTLNGTNFNSLSDIAYKENVVDIENSISILNKIRPVSFNWKDTGYKSYGVIAQEIEKVLPEVVNTTNGTKTVAYSQIIPFLVSAVQELSKEIEELKRAINGNTK